MNQVPNIRSKLPTQVIDVQGCHPKQLPKRIQHRSIYQMWFEMRLKTKKCLMKAREHVKRFTKLKELAGNHPSQYFNQN